MYVEKTTAEERGIIGSKVEGLIIQFDTLTQGFYVNGQMKLFLVEKDQRAKCSLVFLFIVQIFSPTDLQMCRM